MILNLYVFLKPFYAFYSKQGMKEPCLRGVQNFLNWKKILPMHTNSSWPWHDGGWKSLFWHPVHWGSHGFFPLLEFQKPVFQWLQNHLVLFLLHLIPLLVSYIAFETWLSCSQIPKKLHIHFLHIDHLTILHNQWSNFERASQGQGKPSLATTSSPHFSFKMNVTKRVATTIPYSPFLKKLP
jgi:hypothetical protein